jgi:tRNA threonylcarbamoyladenosine biosynthesis protein TsaB
MPILAFDCCFSAVSAAVLDFDRPSEDRVLSARFETMATGHAERLMPVLAEVMSDAACRFGDLDAVAVTLGPGTFTGVRTGLAAARGLALARGLPVLATSSLALLARTAVANPGVADNLAGSTLAIAMDARQGLMFFQVFATGDGRPIGEPALLSPAQAAATTAAGPVLAVGSAASSLVAALHAAGHAGALAMPDVLPNARWMSPLDLARSETPRPIYLRQPDARPQTGASLPRATT